MLHPYNPEQAARWHRRIVLFLLACALCPLALLFTTGCTATLAAKERNREKPAPSLHAYTPAK